MRAGLATSIEQPTKTQGCKTKPCPLTMAERITDTLPTTLSGSVRMISDRSTTRAIAASRSIEHRALSTGHWALRAPPATAFHPPSALGCTTRLPRHPDTPHLPPQPKLTIDDPQQATPQATYTQDSFTSHTLSLSSCPHPPPADWLQPM